MAGSLAARLLDAVQLRGRAGFPSMGSTAPPGWEPLMQLHSVDPRAFNPHPHRDGLVEWVERSEPIVPHCAQHLPTDRFGTIGCAMLRFLLRRAVLALLVCLTVLVISFALTRLSGDLAISIAGPNATAQDIETIRKNYGLDRPLPVQFVDWAVHAARGRSRPLVSVSRAGRRPDQGAPADHADPRASPVSSSRCGSPSRSASSPPCARAPRSTRRSACSRCSARRCRVSGWR